jgi:hypothetical protein
MVSYRSLQYVNGAFVEVGDVPLLSELLEEELKLKLPTTNT